MLIHSFSLGKGFFPSAALSCIFVVALAGEAYSQRAASNGTFTRVDAAGSSYVAGGDTYNFGVGTTNGNEGDLYLDTFQVDNGGGSMATWALDPVLSATVRMQAPDNATSTGLQPWYSTNDSQGGGDTTYNYGPSQATSWQEALSGGVINRGADNPMVNSGNTNLDFERIDFVFDDGLQGTTEQLNNLGFLLNDRGTNHGMAVVAITGLDADGNANSFGSEIFRVTDPGTQYGVIWEGPNADGLTGQNGILKPGSGGSTDPFEPGFDTSNTQDVGGLLLTFSDLGITEGELFYGWALIGDDTADVVLNHASVLSAPDAASRAAAISALLDDINDDTVYLQNTAEGGVPPSGTPIAGSNGLDPTAITGSIVYNTEDPDDPRNGFVQPEPALGLAPLALLLCVFNRRFQRRFRKVQS